MIGRPELDEVAMVTPNNFTGVNWCQCCGHSFSIRSCQSKALRRAFRPAWTNLQAEGIKFDNLKLRVICGMCGGNVNINLVKTGSYDQEILGPQSVIAKNLAKNWRKQV